MAKYRKDWRVDGHPICEEGRPMSKDEIISKLNESSVPKSMITSYENNPRFIIEGYSGSLYKYTLRDTITGEALCPLTSEQGEAMKIHLGSIKQQGGNSPMKGITSYMMGEWLIEYATTYFKEIFALKPNELGKVQIIKDGEYIEHPIYRYFKSYLKQVDFNKDTGKSYMFGGDQPEVDFIPLPSVLDAFRNQFWDGDCQCTVNWYREGIDYIEPHGDCTAAWKGDYVYIVNLMEDPEEVAYLDIYNKDKTEILDSIEMKHGAVVRMDKDFQVDYRHGVGTPPCNRVSLTFRKV